MGARVASNGLNSARRFYALLLLFVETITTVSLVAKMVPPSLIAPLGTEVTFFCNVQNDCLEPYFVVTYYGSSQNISMVKQNSTSLTLKLNATENTNVSCYAVTENNQLNSSSNIALLQVINSKGPSPEQNLLLAESPAAPRVNLTWWPVYLWPGHHIDHYKVLIIRKSKSIDNVSYELKSINKTLTIDDHFVSIDIPAINCTELMITLMAIDTYQGMLDKTFNGTTYYPSDPGDFLDSALTTKVLFDAESIPSLRIEVELPSRLCCFHKINYEIYVENTITSESINFGHFQHTGSAILRHDIDSELKRDMNYSMVIVLNATNNNTITYHATFDTNNSSTSLTSTSSLLTLIMPFIVMYNCA